MITFVFILIEKTQTHEYIFKKTHFQFDYGGQ